MEFIDAEFHVTSQCLVTLGATRAPKDLIQCFQQLRKNRFKGEHYYFRYLSRTLSAVRCGELRSIIFKYTYVGRKK